MKANHHDENIQGDCHNNYDDNNKLDTVKWIKNV